MVGDSTHAGAGESPRPQRSENPYAELQAHLEDLEHFSHQALQQFPRAERCNAHNTTRAILNELILTRGPTP